MALCKQTSSPRHTGLQSTPPPWHRAKFEGSVRCPAKKWQSHQLWTPDIGHRTLDTGHWTPDIGHCTLDTRHDVWHKKIGSQLRKSEVTRKQKQQMVLKYRYCPMPSVRCPRQCPIWCPMSNVRRLQSQSRRGYFVTLENSQTYLTKCVTYLKHR